MCLEVSLSDMMADLFDEGENCRRIVDWIVDGSANIERGSEVVVMVRRRIDS